MTCPRCTCETCAPPAAFAGSKAPVDPGQYVSTAIRFLVTEFPERTNATGKVIENTCKKAGRMVVMNLLAMSKRELVCRFPSENQRRLLHDLFS